MSHYVPLRKRTRDGAYDSADVYAAVEERYPDALVCGVRRHRFNFSFR